MAIQRHTYVKALGELITKMDRVNKAPCKNASERLSKKANQLKLNTQAVAIGVSVVAKDVIILLGVILVTPVKLEILLIRTIVPGTLQNWYEKLDRVPMWLDQIALIVVDILGVGASTAGLVLGVFKGSKWNVAMQKGLYDFSPEQIKPLPPKRLPPRINKNPGNVVPGKVVIAQAPKQTLVPVVLKLAEPVQVLPFPAAPAAQPTLAPVALKLAAPVQALPQPAAPAAQPVPTQVAPKTPANPAPANQRRPAWRNAPSPAATLSPVSKQQSVRPAAPSSTSQAATPAPAAQKRASVAKPKGSTAKPSRNLPSVPSATPPGNAPPSQNPQVTIPAAAAVPAAPANVLSLAAPGQQSIPVVTLQPGGGTPAAGQQPLPWPVPPLALNVATQAATQIEFEDDFASEDSDEDVEDGATQAQRMREMRERFGKAKSDDEIAALSRQIRETAGFERQNSMPLGGGVGSPLPLPALLVEQPSESPIKAKDLLTRVNSLRRTCQDGEKSPRSKKEDELKRIAEEEKRNKVGALANVDMLSRSQQNIPKEQKPAEKQKLEANPAEKQKLKESGENKWD